eukprot:gnl/TRDRNA2_/TRDRNA2_44621_c0_seq1.p1 gnl/TRDRNA2_/TRDRNA2_44621_c0~~gnl/TRDRNA2_/TRDRNA2_44621_c0_seq1.p1  ORF type:complete len:348 (-),score=60.28 gnl/TRDRNA2_/TRDRNA2_44621_c0_seq1:157-1110(-)
MMNGTALRLRGIRPARSLWCEIEGHRRIFYAPPGAATLYPEVGAVTHAVAHDITAAELKILEDREPPSAAVTLRLRGSDAPHDDLVQGVVSLGLTFFLRGIGGFAMKVDDMVAQATSGAGGRIVAVSPEGLTVSRFGHALFDTDGAITVNGKTAGVPVLVERAPPAPATPSARYVNLMVEGAKSVNMPDSEIRKLAATPCTPRKAPEERRHLPVRNDASRYFSPAEVVGNLVVFRGMVFERSSSGLPGFFSRSGPDDAAILLSQTFYDPMYGLPPDDPLLPWEGWGFIEDMLANMWTGCKHVGWMKATTAKREKAKL